MTLPTDHQQAHLVLQLSATQSVTIARADPKRGAHLLGLGASARRSGARQTTARALYQVCERDPVSRPLARLCRAAERAEPHHDASL